MTIGSRFDWIVVSLDYGFIGSWFHWIMISHNVDDLLNDVQLLFILSSIIANGEIKLIKSVCAPLIVITQSIRRISYETLTEVFVK